MSERVKKRKFRVQVKVTVMTTVEVRAESLADAARIVEDEFTVLDFVKIENEHDDSEYSVWGVYDA